VLVTQSDVFDIPMSLSVVLNIRENNTYQRSLYFKNLLGADTLAFQIETSADGGSTWTLIDTAFSVAGGEIVVKEITAPNILRVRASGGGNDRDAYIAYARFIEDEDHEWVTPAI
jgi:hypothetical protein